MPMTIRHALTATTPDVTAGASSGEIRPSHWNSDHQVTLSLASSEVLKAFIVGTLSLSSGNLELVNSNGLTFGMNTNGQITGAHNGLTAQSVQTQGVVPSISAGGASSSGQIVFGNANGMSFGMNNGTITASYTAPTQTNQTLGFAMVGNTTGASSSSTRDARSISFSGAGGISVGMSGGQIVISGAAAGGGADGINRIAAGSQSAGLTATVQFADSNGITFGMSGSNQITASHDGLRSMRVSAGGASSNVAQVMFGNSNGFTFGLTNGSVTASAEVIAATRSGYFPFADLPMTVGQVGNGSLQIDPEYFPNVTFDRILIPLVHSNSSNSSGSHSLSFSVGIYSRNDSVLSLVGSASGSTALTASGTQGNYSLYSGLRHFSIASAASLSEGRYWMAYASSSSSGGADGSYSNLVVNNISNQFVGHFGSSHNTTMQYTLGQGVYSATTNGMPTSIAFTQIRGSDSQAQRMVALQFANSTV